MATSTLSVKPAAACAPARSLWQRQRWLILRRSSQVLILLAFLTGPWFGLWIAKGNLSSSLTLGVVPLTVLLKLIQIQKIPVGSIPKLAAMVRFTTSHKAYQKNYAFLHAQMNFMTLSMRNIIILSILIFSGCLNSDSRPKSLSMIQKIIRIPQSLNIPMDSWALAKISFQELVINFDTIEEGTILQKEIGFFNRGSIPLVIGDVQSSCGCTAISYSTDFIQPDSSGTLLVRFN